MQVRRFDASRWDFPRPRVPVLPSFRTPRWRRNEPAGFRPVFGGEVRRYARGRYALYDALSALGIGPQAGLLAPAYHCRTMLDPALLREAPVRLYRVEPDLVPSMESLAQCVTEAGPSALRALLLPHYFGVAQNLLPVLEFCNHHGLVLIEDCSHCLFVGDDDSMVGRTGALAIGSSYKFFASPDGGLLWANGAMVLPDHALRPAPARQQVRAVIDGLRAAASSRQAPAIAEVDAALSAARARVHEPQDDPLEHCGISAHYLAHEQGLAELAWSRWTRVHTDVAALVQRRRRHYQRWLAAVADLQGCRALFPTLVDGCVPYMFPLLVDDPTTSFQLLKRLGVPIWRWDDMAVSDCPIASRYRLQLLHLPCHQDLSDAELAWMIAAVTAAMATATS